MKTVGCENSNNARMNSRTYEEDDDSSVRYIMSIWQIS